MPDPRFFELGSPLTLAEICELTGASLGSAHPADGRISGVSILSRAGAQDVSFLSDRRHGPELAASAAYGALPRGPVHADLFRDNVMFEDTQLTGLFDFYFAGVDTWLFDLAVCLNDWCIVHADGRHEPARAQALIEGYQSVRPLTSAERKLLPAMLRAGALRFWISRLWDYHLPRQASMLKPHDPRHFERVLRERVHHPLTL